MFPRPSLVFSISLVACCLSLARADTVVLTNGSEFEGEIQENSDRRVVIKVKGGLMTFPRRMVEKVVKSAPPKKKKKKRREAEEDIDPGAPSYWSENRSYAKEGEVWHFSLAPVSEPKPGSEQERITAKSMEMRVERVGLFGIQFGQRMHYRTRAKPQDFWDSYLFTAQGPARRSGRLDDWRGDAQIASGQGAASQTQGYHAHLAKAPTRKLTLAGREFPCKLVTLVSPRKRKGRASRVGRWIYVHYADGQVRWPGLLKQQRGKKVLTLLTKIEPAPQDYPRPPRPWAKPGDWVKVALETGEVKRVVTRVSPTEVEMKREDGTRPTIWRFKPVPVAKQSFPRWRPSKRRHVTVAGKRLLCQEFVDTDNPKVTQLVRISEEGFELWPGVIEDSTPTTIFEKVVGMSR